MYNYVKNTSISTTDIYIYMYNYVKNTSISTTDIYIYICTIM